VSGPPLDLPLLVQLLSAAELEAETAARDQRMPARAALHMEFWHQRSAIVRALARTRRPPRPANTNFVDADQPGLFG
jgi:hypothetical protein